MTPLDWRGRQKKKMTYPPSIRGTIVVKEGGNPRLGIKKKKGEKKNRNERIIWTERSRPSERGKSQEAAPGRQGGDSATYGLQLFSKLG